MRHELYERLGELLATKGGAALLDLQLLPASFLAGTTTIHVFQLPLFTTIHHYSPIPAAPRLPF
jgi:hypothetical protein